jgi:ABC-2 type transport system permease protein
MTDRMPEERVSSASIMMTFWNHPFFLILISIWSIGRGSGAVAAEIERGTMDLILSRPISRTAYLTSHVLVALGGMVFLAVALLTGASLAVHHNVLRGPPSIWTLARPAINFAALGAPIYGYSLLFSSVDQVRWRPSWMASFLTLAGFIAYVIALIPVFHDMWWRPWLERVSLFKAYNPVELVIKGETLGFNVSILGGIGAACIVLAFLVFAMRDLPTNG